ILLYLRDHVTAIASNPDIALPDLVRGTLGRYGADEPEGWFEQRLDEGDCLVLLDGLDEVARPEDRRAVAGWVECQIRQYPKNDYVITSRPQGYLTARIDGAAVLQVRSFTEEQVTRFVQSWYVAVERLSTGATEEDVRLKAQSEADDLLQRLKGAAGLYDLTVNPLLLTMIATVHRYRGALPGSRVDLYGEICQVMLWRRHEAIRIPVVPDGDKKEALLRRLAFAMMRRQVRDLPRADVLAEIGPALRRISRNLTAEEFLSTIGSNGLLIERESGLYSFAHQTFQEYLAAAYIRDKGLSDVLVDAVDDVWWRETTLLYTARSDADPIVRACLASTSVIALSLAFDCAEQGSELAPELRDLLEDLPATAFASATDPERRRGIAGVLLTRHLRHLVRTGNGGRVCTRPITTDLYQLYLQDTRPSAPELSPRLESGPQEPIMGVSRSDAVAFVHWVNRITGTDTVYRLPQHGEINDSALNGVLTTSAPGTPPRSVWLESDDEHGQPELWAPAGTDHPHLIEATTLTRHVTDDIERSIPTLIRLLLIRSIITVRVFIRDRDLDLYLGLARDPDRDRDLALALAGDLDLAFALDRHLDRVLARVFALDFALGLDLGLARDLARDLARVFALNSASAHVFALALDLDRALDFARDRARDRDLARALDFARGLDLDLDLDLVVARHFARDLARDLVLALDGLRAQVMGSALTHALTRVLRRYPPMATWPAEFAQVFIDETGIAEARHVVSPDALTDKIHSGSQALLNLLGPVDDVAPLPWVHLVTKNLQEAA
ncbi:MAG: NACHT domain-containing protein, partial [Pseudonocardiaceae bacterium]